MTHRHKWGPWHAGVRWFRYCRCGARRCSSKVRWSVRMKNYVEVH